MNSFFRIIWRTVLIVIVIGSLGACASNSRTRDPLEGFNRKVFEFNDAVDKVTLKPAAQAYQAVVPQPIRTCINNIMYNLTVPTTALNNLLQGKIQLACEDTIRFAFNHLFGFAGCLDIASEMGLKKNREDFGQTLATWGVPSGPYLVLPLLGPSTLRDALTDNDFANIDASRKIHNSKERNLFRTVEAVNSRAAILTAEGVVNDIALDRYSFIRDAFLQRRRNAIYDGDPPELPPESEKVEKTPSAAPSASKVEEAPAVPLEEKK